MADDATMTISALILPDEISKTLASQTFSYTPANDTEGWYYKLTDIITTTNGAALIDSGVNYMQFGGGNQGSDIDSPMHTTADGDKVKFLFIKHMGVTDDGTTTNTADSVYITFDGGNVAGNTADAIEVGPGESWFCKPGCTIADIHAISAVKNKGGSGGNKIQCIVAAIIDNV